MIGNGVGSRFALKDGGLYDGKFFFEGVGLFYNLRFYDSTNVTLENNFPHCLLRNLNFVP